MAKTLLLADDSVTIQKVVGISFASEDIQITTVDNGDAALARARELRPDVILADVVMPGKNGYEVCEAVQQDPALRHIPVLLLTGTFEAFDEERARRAGAAGHVAKPFEAQTLVERVKELLARTPVAAAPPVAPAPAAPRAAAVPAPPRAAVPPPVPAAAPASSAADQSFDFFDDAPEAPQGATTRIDLDFAAGGDDALPLESGDDAFAFGEDDLVPATSGDADAGGHTIAMLPDEMDLPARSAVPAHTPGETILAAAPHAGGRSDEEAFDFEFERMPAAQRSDDAALAEAALLDPAGDSAFDVSASDLGDLVGDVSPPPMASTRILSFGEDDGALGAHDGAEDDDVLSAEALPFELGDEPPARAPAAPRAAQTQLADTDPDPVWSGPPPVGRAHFIEEVPTAPPARPRVPAPDLSFAEDEDDAEGFLMASEPVRAPAPEPAAPRAPEPRAAAPAGPSGHAATPAHLSADALLDEIGPALRAQLHETLEKVAWESFGPLTEQLVEQALERIEKVAWEVVPRLAETLILEEIRKLKGGA